MTEVQPSRRAADVRLDGLEKRVGEIATDVREIRDAVLIQRGAWRAFIGFGIVLGTIGTFFGIASWLGFGPH